MMNHFTPGVSRLSRPYHPTSKKVQEFSNPVDSYLVPFLKPKGLLDQKKKKE